jgi:serine/threonine-protein kinase
MDFRVGNARWGVYEGDTVAVKLEQFVEHLTQSGLMSAADIASFEDSLPADKRPKDGEALARELVRANKITKYQAQLVYQGKPKGLVFGEYVVLDKLGQGGMGIVLKAQHRRMDRIVAVKMILGSALKSPDAVKRFYREVKAAAKLMHTNIVAAHDAGEHEGGHYLVMEYVEGKDLSAVVKDNGPLPVSKAVDYIIQAARGLEYAHKRGIIHRDIKPANLLLDKEGTVKILDMGLARVGGAVDEEDKDRLTASGQVMGSVDYMAPEQAVDTHHADARADIYSLGCTLYRLLTNEVLYKGDTLVKILISHQQSPIPSLCQARSDVPPQLDAVFQKMVAKKPEARQQTMTEVIAELESCAGKRETTVSAVNEEATADYGAENLSFLKTTAPRSMTTAAKKKGEKVSEVTLSQQAAASETSRQLPKDEQLLAIPKKKKTLIIAVAAGLLGLIGIISVYLAITIRVERPDGSKMVIQVPDDSKVTVTKDDAGKTAAKQASYGPGAPPLAKPSMSSTEAAQVQKQWADYLGVPVEQTNSIGMKLTLIPPGEFDMGSTPEEIAWATEETKKDNEPDSILGRLRSEVPRHHVRLTKPLYVGTYTVTQSEYKTVMGVNPSSFTTEQADASIFNPPLSDADIEYRRSLVKRVAGKDTSRLPVEMVNWDEVTEFCRRLSAMPGEHGRRYRLPTEAEWEYACRAGTTTRWHCGDREETLRGFAWFNKNAGNVTHPVGDRQSNAWNLFDMHGNVWQWCGDKFREDYYAISPDTDPRGPSWGDHMSRGGGFGCKPLLCRSAFRTHNPPDHRAADSGFRIVYEVAPKGARTAPLAPASPSNAPPPAIAPFDAAKAKQHQEAWAKHLGIPVEQTNSIGMKLVLIPPGEFEMGSTDEEIQWAMAEGKQKNPTDKYYFEHVPTEAPRHHVKITRPFYLGMYQVTQGEYEKLLGVNPSAFTEKQVDTSTFKPPLSEIDVKSRQADMKKIAGKDTSRHPVETVSWEEAMGFCRTLSAMRGERTTRRVYRLPTEAEWEYACRAGTTTRWQCGDDEVGVVDVAWFSKNSRGMTCQVGQKRPNAWGLFDMHGNVWQWCSDWFSADYYKQFPPSDPIGPAAGSCRVLRGGACSFNSSYCRSASRSYHPPASRSLNNGFRVVCEIAPNEQVEWNTAIDLMPLIDPKKDTVGGTWVAGTSGLEATDIKCMSQKIQPPYRPAEEYDYRVSFTPIAGNADVAVGLTAKGRSFVFYMKRYSSDHCSGFECIDRKIIASGPTARRFPHLELGRRYTVFVEVRKDGLKAWLDGELMAQWATDYHDMSPFRVWKFKDDSLLGVGCSLSKVVFHEIQVREVTGKGTFMRGAVKTNAIDPAFLKEVAALPAEEQVARVVAKLKELNPGYDGKETHTIFTEQVTRLGFSVCAVKDISPVRALQSLELLTCSDERARVAHPSPLSPLADLSPLRGLRLTKLTCNHTEVSDLSPLVGMPLTFLQCNDCPVADLTPLRGMPLEGLRCSQTKVSDLSPLVGMPLKDLECNGCPIVNLTPLHGMSLYILLCHRTSVNDLSPLKGMPLTKADFGETKVTDLSPIRNAPLNELRCDFDPKRDTEILRSIKTLEKINDLPVAEFWKRVEAGKIPPPK